MKIIKNGTTVIVVLDDGSIVHKTQCEDSLFNELVSNPVPEKVLSKIDSNYEEQAKKYDNYNKIVTDVNNSKLLTKAGDSIYWTSVSSLSMPPSLVSSVLEAEAQNNEDALEAYHNFWLLLSLNPDSRCRENLFWYLNHWGMKISKSGLFIGYRNVDIYTKGTESVYTQSLCDFTVASYERIRKNKKGTGNYWIVVNDNLYHLCHEDEGIANTKDDNAIIFNLKSLYEEFKAVNFIAKNIGDDTIYTDHHSHTFRIKIGEIVSMPREDCDQEQTHQCSRGSNKY